jgi:hypothetical protein
MNTPYLMTQMERTRTAAEQREIDLFHAQLAESFARLRRLVAAPFRGLALTGDGRARRAAVVQRAACR